MRQHQQSISTYYNMLKGLRDELGSYLLMPSCQCDPTCKCGVMKELADREQQEQVLQFLIGLNDTSSTVRMQMLLMSPLPMVRKAYSMLLQEERQQQITENSTISSVHAMNTSNSTNKQPRRVHDDDNKNLHCTHCNGDTHTYMGANNTTQEPQKGTITQMLDDLKFTPQLVNQIKSFLRGDGKIQSFANATVNIPNGSHAHISCLGSIQITPHLKLEDDLTTKKMIGLGKEHNGMYYLVHVTEDFLRERDPIIAAAALSSTSDLCHKRLGHLSTDQITIFSKFNFNQ
ncbi:unnamed protein product [Prunus armeniaca]